MIIIGGLLIAFLTLKKDNKKEEDYSTCDECGHLFDKRSATKITVYDYLWHDKREKIYCVEHSKPYDQIQIVSISSGDTEYYKNVPEHRERVNEDGTPFEQSKSKKSK